MYAASYRPEFIDFHGLVSFGSLKDIGFTSYTYSVIGCCWRWRSSFFMHSPHFTGHFSVCPIVTCFLSRHFRTKIKCRTDVQARNVAMWRFLCARSIHLYTSFLFSWPHSIRQCAIEQENDFFSRSVNEINEVNETFC